jgi:fused signal recognition particle receptor
MFKVLQDRLSGWRRKAGEQVAQVVTEGGGRRIDPKKLDIVLYDLEMALLESDVAFPVAKAIVDRLATDLAGRRMDRRVALEEGVERVLREAVESVLRGADSFDFWRFIEETPKPVVLLFVGVNGTGKTTAIAKIAHLMQQRGYDVVLAAADTFRAGAIEQLERHAERLGAKLIKHKAGSDPAAVAYDAVAHAKARGKDVVLIDTAGRMQTNRNLMDQMRKIKRVASPHLTIFVGDALAGNDAVDQARTFEEAVGFDAAILCKIDADAKGGAALSIAHTVGRPVVFVGTGQGYEDLLPFDPKWMTSRLFAEAAP